MSERTLITQPRLSLVTRHADAELSRIHGTIEHKVLVDGRSDMEVVLGKLLAVGGSDPTPKTLDLIGHSTPGSSLLQLGDWAIDTGRASVTAFFRELAELDVLPRLGIHAVRLLGCNTAETAQGRATICALSDILEMEVYGSTGLLFSAHYDAAGFQDRWRFLLVGASDLRRAASEAERLHETEPDPRSLDVDALPAVPLAETPASWPRRIANDRAARTILRMVRRDEGARMPGLLSLPSCEIAMPSSTHGLYHLAQVVLDGQFIRVYPDGRSGVLYPVTQPQALRALVEHLPAA